MEKSTAISIGAVVVALAAVVANTSDSRETKTLVAATASAADVEVSDVLKANDTVRPVHCKKQYALVNGSPVLTWCCDDIGCNDAARVEILNKRAGAEGTEVSYIPSEKADGAVGVDVRVVKGSVEAYKPVPIGVYDEAAIAAEKAAAEAAAEAAEAAAKEVEEKPAGEVIP